MVKNYQAPKVSVIIPCYNMGDYVKEAIESVLSYPLQKDIEIIVVNDGSDDNGFTHSVLNSYNQTNITIVHQENKGLGNARNTGIKLSKAPYVLLLDADNKIRHTYIEEGINVLDNNPEVALVYGMNKKMGLREDVVEVGVFDITRLLLKNYIDACAVLRKSAWKDVDGYDEKMPVMGFEDWDINLRLFSKGWRFQYLQKVCFDYRVREGSMLENSNNNKDQLVAYIFKKEELKQLGLLRKSLLELEDYKKMEQRTIIAWALKMEQPLKRILGKQND